MNASDKQASPRTRAHLAILAEAQRKWDHARALVEQASARKSGVFRRGGRSFSKSDPDRELRKLVRQIRSVATDVANLLSEQPFTELGEQVQELLQLARGTPSRSTLYRMREVVSAVYQAFELAAKQFMRRIQEVPESQSEQEVDRGEGT